MFKRILFICSIMLLGQIATAQNFPPRSNTLVTDFTNTLRPEEKQRLENKLIAFADSTSTQIAVVIVKTVGDSDINEYGQELGRRWGIGERGKNNGILLLVALDDHKLTIQVGYGLENALPDAIVAQIRTQDVNPRFRTGDFYGGLDAGTDDIIKYTKGKYTADTGEQTATEQPQDSGSAVGAIVVVFIIIIVILIIIFRKRNDNSDRISYNRGGGRFVNNGGQIISGSNNANPLLWYAAADALDNLTQPNNAGSPGNFSDSGNDNSSISDDSSSSDDDRNSGGGDFGGGDFGGGGSGGDW